MNFLFLVSAVLSFALSYWIGKQLKSYWSLFASLPLGILIAVPTVFLYIRFGDIERVGLGIIALLPALIVLTSFFNVASSLTGILAGTFRSKKKNNV